MEGLFKTYATGVFDIEDLTKKNRVIAHPDDYVKMAESGLVKSLVDGGIDVVMSTHCEKGKVVCTGELAVKLFDDKAPTPPGAE